MVTEVRIMVTFGGELLAARVHEGAFWDAENVLYLDLSGG